MPDAAVTVPNAAREFGVTARQVQTWLAQGAPVARRGRRGRGCATLLDLSAIRAWRDARVARVEAGRLQAFSGEVSEIVANAVYAAFLATEGPHKRAAAGVLAAAWYRSTCAMREALGDATPEPSCVPEKITALLRINGDR